MKANAAKTYDLSRRENDVAALLAKGTPRKNIADRLELSVNTIDVYLRNLRRKCRVETTFELHCIFSHYRFPR